MRRPLNEHQRSSRANREAPLSDRRRREGVAQAFFISLMHLDRNFLRTFPCRPFASACLEHSIDAALRGVAGAFSFICATATLPDARNARLRAVTNFHMSDSPNQDAKARHQGDTTNTPTTTSSGTGSVGTPNKSQFPSSRTATPLQSRNPRAATSQQPRDSNLHRLCCNARRIDCRALRVEGSTRWMAFAELLIISS